MAYFIAGMAVSVEKVHDEVKREASTGSDQSRLLGKLDARQRQALTLFEKPREVTAKDIGALFGFCLRTSAWLCRRGVSRGFLLIADPAKKSRRYRWADQDGPSISRAT